MIRRHPFATIGLLGVAFAVLAFGATWAFAQGGAAGAPDASPGSSGGGVFVWYGVANADEAQCYGVPGVFSDCINPFSFGQVQIPLPSSGHLTRLAIHPYDGTMTKPLHIVVLVNGAPTSLSVLVPGGSTSVTIGAGSVAVNAGDLVAIRNDPVVRPPTATPPGYPPPPPPPETMSYVGSLQYTTP